MKLYSLFVISIDSSILSSREREGEELIILCSSIYDLLRLKLL